MDSPAPIPAPETTASTRTRLPKVPKVPRVARANTRDDLDTQHSKTLSYILRHGAAKESLTLRDDGFVRVADLMKRPKLKHCDLETLERIVRDNEKQRFTMRAELTVLNGEEEMWIRANQGHSIAVENLELKLVTKVEDLPTVVHGTYLKLWEAILKEGLKTMTRNHIHCAVGLVGSEGVTSGMRASCDLFIYLDVPKLFADNIALYTSTNHVVLTAGVDGVIEPKYFSKVITKSGEILLPLASP